MKDRLALAKYFSELGFKTGAEVGVLAGHYSMVLCEANPDLKLYCIDSWGFGDIRHSKYHLRTYRQAKRRLAHYNTTLVRKRSLDAVKDFENNSLDFVFIDASHSFDNVVNDIIEWSKKVIKDGIVAGHDYMPIPSSGVKEAVDAYTRSHHLDLQLTTESDKSGSSWWFVKT